MATLETNRIGGALADFWFDGSGPSRSMIQAKLLIAGHHGKPIGANKLQIVLNSITESEEPIARVIVEELVGLLRDNGAFDRSPDPAAPDNRKLEKLASTIRAAGHRLTKDLHIEWATTQESHKTPGSAGTSAISGSRTHTTPAQATATNIAHTRRSRLFIGSTVEALSVAQAVQAELDHDIDVTIWNQAVFLPGITTWAQLVESTRNYDYGLFVFSGDDEVRSRGVDSLAVRDNLLIEFGLFVGVLGPDRVFFLYNRDHKPKIATDLGGVTPLTYRDREDENLRASVSPACVQLRQLAQQHRGKTVG